MLTLMKAVATILFVAIVMGVAVGDSPPVKSIDFARDVQPILAKNCLSCHGPDKQKNGLRLDTVTAILSGGDSGPAVVAGKPDQSLLFTLVSGAAADGRIMPPKGDRLSAADIDAVKLWISQGAK